MYSPEKNLLICKYCGEANTNLRLCGACKVVRYCSSDHQRKDWKLHKKECSKFKLEKEESIKTKGNESLNISQGNENSEIALDKSLLDSILISDKKNGINNDCNEQDDLESDSSVSSSSEKSNIFSNSLNQLKLNPDNQSISNELGSEWLANVTSYVLRDLNKYGFCAVDNFFGSEKADRALNEVVNLHSQGKMTDGQVISKQVKSKTRMIRGDKIAWVNGIEQGCETISDLITTIDTVIAHANKHQEAGNLANYDITLRTRAMVACYPGKGTHYVKHVDNPNSDGRCITAIYYINKNWKSEDGGILRIYPKGVENRIAQIEPKFDRMLFFWSDRRNPHEVLPSSSTRYAITVWYFDQKERDLYKARCMNEVN